MKLDKIEDKVRAARSKVFKIQRVVEDGLPDEATHRELDNAVTEMYDLSIGVQDWLDQALELIAEMKDEDA